MSEPTSDILSRLRGVALSTPATHFALVDGAELLALVECVEAATAFLKYIDDHDWGHIPEGVTGERLRDALAKLGAV